MSDIRCASNMTALERREHAMLSHTSRSLDCSNTLTEHCLKTKVPDSYVPEITDAFVEAAFGQKGLRHA